MLEDIQKELEKLWKDFQKSNQKIRIWSHAMMKAEKRAANQQKIKKIEKNELETVKKAISTSSEGLQGSIKGQFGKKVKEVFDEQKQTLDTLK